MAEVIVVGSFVQDLGFKTETFPAAGETRIGKFQTGPGGKGFNQAVAAKRAGAEVLFIGAIGEDGFGEAMRHFSASERLKIELQTVPRCASGAAAVVVNDKCENIIVVALGANDQLTSEHIRGQESKFSAAKVLICQLESSISATRSALELGRVHSLVNILNPAPINPLITAELLALADIITPNETEFSFLLKALFDIDLTIDPECINEADLHKHCRRLGTPTVVITLGKRGAFVSHSNLLPRWAAEDTQNYYLVDAIEVAPTDTTGAGDAFSGGLACGLLRSKGEFRHAVTFANAVAGLSTERPGTAPSMPSLSEVEKRMKEA